MKRVFADSLYWIALANPRDQWHRAALDAERQLNGTSIVTTDEVLTELLAAVSAGGPHLRQQAVRIVRTILDDPAVSVLPQSHDSFEDGLALYEARADKQYSLTDCVSMNVCRAAEITDILTNDHHFEQEGFTLLIRN